MGSIIALSMSYIPIRLVVVVVIVNRVPMFVCIVNMIIVLAETVNASYVVYGCSFGSDAHQNRFKRQHRRRNSCSISCE